jgi:hypothetical protein
VIKSGRIRWAVHVALVGERISLYRVLVGNLVERDHLEKQSVEGKYY